MIAEEIDGQKPRIKLYTDGQGNFKGDALVVYFRAESVELAVQMLDDTQFRSVGDRPGSMLSVVEAVFQNQVGGADMGCKQIGRRSKDEGGRCRLLVQTAEGGAGPEWEEQQYEGEEEDHQEDAEIE